MQRSAYLSAMRANSSYPVFRRVVSTLTTIAYVVAGLTALSGVVALGSLGAPGLILVGLAALIAIFAKVGQEVSLMVADIADATLDLASGRDEARSASTSERPGAPWTAGRAQAPVRAGRRSYEPDPESVAPSGDADSARLMERLDVATADALEQALIDFGYPVTRSVIAEGLKWTIKTGGSESYVYSLEALRSKTKKLVAQHGNAQFAQPPENGAL